MNPRFLYSSLGAFPPAKTMELFEGCLLYTSPSENEVDEYYLTGWAGNPLDSFAGLLNITQVHDVVVTGEGTLDCDAENGDWWVNPKVKRIAWRPRAVAAVDSENVCLHGITVQNSYSWTIHPIFVKHLDLSLIHI